MTFNKTLAGILSVAGLTALSASAAMAQGGLTPIGSVTTATSNNTIFTSSATGDTLSVAYDDGTFAGKVGNGSSTNDIVRFNATGGTTAAFSDGSFKESFTGGTFSLFSNTGTDLLNGTLGASSIRGGSGDLSGGLNAIGVTYTAASTALPPGFSLTGGTISLTYNVINSAAPITFSNPPSGYTLTAGRLNSFTATDSGVYSALAGAPATVPEPATVLPFVFGGLGLLVLVARKVRKTANVTA